MRYNNTQLYFSGVSFFGLVYILVLLSLFTVVICLLILAAIDLLISMTVNSKRNKLWPNLPLTTGVQGEGRREGERGRERGKRGREKKRGGREEKRGWEKRGREEEEKEKGERDSLYPPHHLNRHAVIYLGIFTYKLHIHHLFTTLLLGSKPISVLAIQTVLYRE